MYEHVDVLYPSSPQHWTFAQLLTTSEHIHQSSERAASVREYRRCTMAYGLPDWLTGGPSEQQPAPVREKSQDGGYIAPDRGQRELCYESRDILFGCLDKHDILDANREDEKMRKLCPDQNVAYERDCARSWVSHAWEVWQ